MPTTFFEDTMTAAAGTTLNATTSSSGHEWDKHPASLATVFIYDSTGGAVHVTNTFGGETLIAAVVPPSPNYYVEAVVHAYTVGVSQYPIILARLDPNAMSYYGFIYNSPDQQWEIEKIIRGGAGILLGTPYAQALSNADYTIRITVNGPSITCDVDGVTRITATDYDLTQPGRAGLQDYHDGASTNSTLIHFSAFKAVALDQPELPAVRQVSRRRHGHAVSSPGGFY
jgi:hypothetical protein